MDGRLHLWLRGTGEPPESGFFLIYIKNYLFSRRGRARGDGTTSLKKFTLTQHHTFSLVCVGCILFIRSVTTCQGRTMKYGLCTKSQQRLLGVHSVDTSSFHHRLRPRGRTRQRHTDLLQAALQPFSRTSFVPLPARQPPGSCPPQEAVVAEVRRVEFGLCMSV